MKHILSILILVAWIILILVLSSGGWAQDIHGVIGLHDPSPRNKTDQNRVVSGSLVCDYLPFTDLSLHQHSLNMKCNDNQIVVMDITQFVINAPGQTNYTITRGGNSVTWILTRGTTATYDTWQVIVNGTVRGGSFQWQ